VNAEWAAGGALAGLFAALVLRGPVFRMSVASGAPERTACPRCAAPVRRWFAVRCRQCGASIGVPVVLELATAGVLALLAAKFAGRPEVAAYAFAGAVGVALAAIDLSVKRLPDRLTLPAAPVMLALLVVAAVLDHDAAALLRAVLGGLALAACYLLLALIGRGQLGGGDVKLAGLAGVAMGWLGWPTLIIGAALGFVLAAVTSLLLIAARRLTLRSAISFGPFLLAGALLAILATVPHPGK
jgi:leader peptidase (prepilin peptidase) / N-methyltransferase